MRGWIIDVLFCFWWREMIMILRMCSLTFKIISRTTITSYETERWRTTERIGACAYERQRLSANKSENIHFSSLFPECCGFLQGAVWPDSSCQHEAVYPDRVYLADEQWAVPEGNRGPERDLPHHGSSRSCPWTAAESTQCLRHGKPTFPQMLTLSVLLKIFFT